MRKQSVVVQSNDVPSARVDVTPVRGQPAEELDLLVPEVPGLNLELFCEGGRGGAARLASGTTELG